MNAHINNNTTTPNYIRILQTLPTYINGNFTYLNNNYAYIIFNSNGSILFKEDTPCELLIVGAGGRGGIFSIFGGAGGGGSGEIIYNPSFTFSSNSYDIIVGIDNADSNQRISKIIANNQIIINANGGGDGAFWDGVSYGEIQRFPPQSFTSNSPILNTTFLNRSCYKSTIYVNSNPYEVFYSSRKENTSFDAINLFNCLEPSSTYEAVFLNEQYNNSGATFNYLKSNFIIDFRYKGDWVCIKLPIPILLTSYSFFQNETETGGAPNNFKIYGSTNGIDWDVVKDRNLFVNLSYLNYKYTEVLSPLPTKPYLYYALVVNSLVGNLSYLNFNEWVLNGKPILITPSTMNGGSSVFNLPSNQIQGGFGGSYINQNLIKIIKENSSINIPYDNYFFKINRNPLNTYINSGIYSAVFNEGFITFANETYLSFPILTSIEPEYWYKFNSSSGFNDNFIITGTIIKNLNDVYFNYGVYLKPFINELWNSNGISFSFWIKPELEIGNNLWIFKTIDNPNEFISFHNNEFKISNNGLITSVNFNINLLDGLYHHFVCSIDPSGKIIVACDGIIYENYSVNPFINKSYKDGRIGEFYQGYMKDFRIYLKVLDFNEIQELFKGRIEIFYNRFNENITTTNIQIGSGGIGGTSNSIPTIKNYYGDGGDGNRDGNLGLGFQGIVIIKYPYPYFKTTLTSYKFPNSQFLKFSGLNNSNGIPFKLLTNNNDNRVLSINDLNFHISSNEPYIQSTSNIDINNTLFINSNGNIGFGKNLGINIIAEEINPIAWYKFDDPNNLGKDEFNSYNLTLVNNPIINSTIFNKGIGCISLSRQNNQYLILNNLNLTNLSFSISLWSYLLNYDNVLTPLFYKGNENEYFIISYRFNNTIDFEFNGYILSAENLPNDTNIWINWVFTYDNDNKIIRIYRNGLKIAEDFFPYFFHITHDYNIGRALVNQIERYFDGNIDDFRIYNKVLNDNQIQELYNGKVEIYSYNNNNINFETNIGINNSLSINDFTIQKYNSNISFINPSGFNGIGTTNPLNFLDIRNDVYMSKLNINSLDITLINTNQNSLFIRDNSIIKFNYINDTKINSGFYNINFINGSIILDSLNPDKSYPILKDLYSIEKEYPPNKYNSFTTEIISSGEIFNINPSNYYKETITYKNQIYEIYSSGTTNDIARTRARLFNKNAIYSFSDIGAYWGYNNYNTITGIQRNNRYIINDYLGEWCIIKFPVSFILTKYIISVQTEYLIRAPSLIRFYGSFDGINWNIIQEAEILTPLTSNNYSSSGIYEKILNDTFNISYLYIGFTINKIIGDPNGSNFTPLSIAELRIFGKEIEENIINPIVWYKFDNSSNQMLLDSSSNNYNLINNGATFDTTTFIKGNGSVNFNHSLSQYISIPSINLYNIQSVNGISFCLWFKMNTIDTGTWPRIFDFNNGNIITPRWILISRYLIDNKLNFDIYNGNIQISRITTNDYIDDNWHHIVWSISNLGNWIIYIDGLIATFTETLPTNVNIENINFTNNNFGKSLYNLDGYLSGNIDDFRIYNFVLNSNQVQELYKGRIEIYTYQNSNNNLNIFGNAMISQTADIGNLILNGVIYKNNGIPYIDSGWTTMLEDKSNIFNSYSVVGIGTIFPRFQNRLDVNGSILCDDIFVNGALLTNDYIKKSGTTADTISLGTLKISSGGTGVNSFTSNQILNSTIVWSNNSLNILGNINNSNIINNNEKIVLNNGIKIGNINIDNYGISNGNSNSNIIIGNNFFINSNIGIGTTNPNNLLDIRGNMRINRVLEVNNISNNEILNGISMNISNINIENSGIINRYLSRWGNSNNFMGFVGIGTTNPINSLDIIGNVGIKGILNVSNISNTNIFNGISMNVSNINIENSIINYKNNNICFLSRWNLSNSGIVYNSGFVGITTNILNSNLNVNGNVSMKGFLNMNNSNISNINWFGGRTLKVNNLRFLTNSSGIINFINGSTYNVNNWTTIGSKAYYNYGNVGIRTSTNQINSLDINGDLNFNSNISNFNNQIFNFENLNTTSLISISSTPIINITNNSINNSYGYYQFNSSRSITFNRDLLCDVLVVGAGGDGGSGTFSGGGGAGEVIYQPNYIFEKGLYDLSVGVNATNINNRISKITKGTTEIFKALGGGNGNIGKNIPITITNNGSTLLNHQINFTLSYNNFFNSNFQDLRFFDTDTITPLDYYIENIVNGVSATIWIKIPSLTASKIIYMKSQFSNSTGNPHNVFDIYEDFSVISTLDNTKWSNVGGSTTFTNNLLYISTGDVSGKKHLITKNNMPIDSIADVIMTATGSTAIPELSFRLGTYGQTNSNYGISGRYDTRGSSNLGMGVVLNNPYNGWTDFAYPSSANNFAFPSGSTLRKTRTIILGNTITFYYASNLTSAYSWTFSHNFGNSVGYNTQGKFGLNNHGGDNFVIKEVKLYKATANTITISNINYNIFLNSLNSTGGSGGGSYLNANNQSFALTKWNNIYSYVSSGNNGTTLNGGNGGSSLINSTYNLTGTNQIIGIGGLGSTLTSIPVGNKSFGCGGDGNGGLGGSGVIIIKVIKEIRNFNLTRNYLFNNGTDYTILTENNNIINPIIWYKFDGSLTFLNDNINTLNNLINYDGIYDTTNYVKGIGSIYFNNPSISSSQKYAIIPNNILTASYLNTLNLANGLSFSFWINLSSSSMDYNRILYFGNFQVASPYYDNTNCRLQIRTSSPKTTAIYFDIVQDGFYTFQYNANIYDNNWKHIVWTISPLGIWNIYINNLLICDNEAKIVFPLLSSTNLIYLLGIDKHPDNYGIIGNFDDFRIYNRVLNKSQVSELYENSRINFIINGNSFSKGTNYISSINDYPLLTYANSNIINPIAWYKFDDSTNLGKDEMDNHNLTNNSSVSYNSTNFIKGTGSSSFNGTNQFLSKTSAFNLNSKDFSICFWINRTSNNRNDEIIVIGSSTLALQFLNIAINDTNKIAFNWSQENFISDNAYTDAGTWVHLCFTYKTGIKIKTIYRNGIVIKAGSTLNEVLTGNDIRIGADLNSRFFQGLLDDLRIYDFELSQSQVLELYNTTNNYQTLINYPTNYFSSYSSNLHNPFIRTSNNDLEILSYTNNDINSILLQSNIKLITNNSNQLIINSNLISINKSLDISGNSGTITNEAGAYITTSSSAFLSGYMPEYTTFSLKTFDNIICGKNSYALSDKRIKTNISNIDDMNSLEKILKIEPKIYGYIDNIQRTNSNVYGFLAQQIRDVLPEATELTTKFIPDIFKLTKINGNRINLNDEELKKINIEDILEIYTKNNSYQVKVINKDNDGININIDIIDNDIFIYGRQVKDFHIIDKSYLYTLNICATQELARIVEGLKQRINNL